MCLLYVILGNGYKRNGNYGSKKSTVKANLRSVNVSTDQKLTFVIPMIVEYALGLDFPLVNIA